MNKNENRYEKIYCYDSHCRLLPIFQFWYSRGLHFFFIFGYLNNIIQQYLLNYIRGISGLSILGTWVHSGWRMEFNPNRYNLALAFDIYQSLSERKYNEKSEKWTGMTVTAVEFNYFFLSRRKIQYSRNGSRRATPNDDEVQFFLCKCALFGEALIDKNVSDLAGAGAATVKRRDTIKLRRA